MASWAPLWLTIFLDASAHEHEAVARFWTAATGYRISAARGADGEFATLVPPEGDDHLRVQRVGARSGIHLDLHVADLEVALAHAVTCGAVLLARPDHAVLRSPGGFRFCLVPTAGTRPAPSTRWPAGHRSRVDQATLDIPARVYEPEVAFWSALTGWPVSDPTGSEFRRLHTPAALPVRILLQRLDGGDDGDDGDDGDVGDVGGHVDIATDDRAAEVSRLCALGAEVIGEGPRWTVLRPPGGPLACVTERDPETGLPGESTPGAGPGR